MTDHPPHPVAALRAQFPALDQQVHGKPLCYLDNAATTQKPLAVLAAMERYNRVDCANVHRGLHALAVRADESYEAARESVRRHLNAEGPEAVIFTSGTTAAVNLAAWSFGEAFVRPGDEILVTGLEHHSNLVPWQLLCQRRGARLVVAHADERGEVSLDEFRARLSERTRLAALTHVSNALGTVNPVRGMIALAHEAGARVLVDGAQAVPHLPVDVQELGADLYAFSGHKVYGPTGIGVLAGRRELLEQLPPWQGGGDMIASVSYEDAEFNQLPWRLEAGTPPIAGAIGLGAALDFLGGLDPAALAAHEEALLARATALLEALPGVRIAGRPRHRAAVLSFNLTGAHPSDVATLLDLEGVAVRSGHHCAQPLMDRLGLPGTVRASFACYNTLEEVERLAAALGKTQRLLGV
ncbi:MAG: SufS family cysteine desulfurase [bacterium]|jgi:cysteine desulfurase/selenocysteine lyase|nr:SufS family cysteine desulfurase [bacterium]